MKSMIIMMLPSKRVSKLCSLGFEVNSRSLILKVKVLSFVDEVRSFTLKLRLIFVCGKAILRI